MILLAAFLLGGISGIALWLYISGFIENLQREIYTTYRELFPQNPPVFQSHFASIQGKKCGHILGYFFLCGAIFTALNIITKNPFYALWLGGTILLLWTITYLDWQYQLISSIPCLWLTTLGLFGAFQSFSVLTLEQSLQSAVGFFLVFYGIYWVAKWYYKKEAFGQGDYWLALGLGSYLPFEHFPFFLLIACLSGILFRLIFPKRNDFLPFAPFLCLSTFVVWLVNYSS
ncbi:prepilin peptidase [Rodentibacter trehalosifermentans]|uniref:Prepilin peptidase n=1 Tax=Rodentibacter trehalosifermentans TaxID=1908263 RepID=A0A1V3ILB3_9PAST|nr:A24 family peptidase [Rodentibacter trehalosifermentans]OOF42551.1 prepilin peptidase [Rodentibacter trehalosifermentans]OOF52839.1 prepilin peptidase [Rodentibacter trehalosifermentans]